MKPKKCPFCGAELELNEIKEYYSGKWTKWYNHPENDCIFSNINSYQLAIRADDDKAIERWNNRTSISVDDLKENPLSIFPPLCFSCIHRKVCKEMKDPPNTHSCECYKQDASCASYTSIDAMFQPIFDWVKKYYPAGGVRFIVDHNSAKMYLEHGPAVYSEEITKVVSDAHKVVSNEQKKETD